MNFKTTSSASKVSPDHPFFGIVQEAYQAFARGKPASIGVQEACCMYPEIEADFFNPEIRSMPLHYIQDWFGAEYLRGGVPKPTWAYLLPRILEILASGLTLDHVGVEVSLNRFESGNPDNWTAAQWDVLDRFQRMYLKHQIENGKVPLDEVLCMFRLGGWSLAELLSQVSMFADETLAQRFWHDWCEGHIPGRESVWITSFWDVSDKSAVFEFYTSPALRDRMEALALADHTEPRIAAMASAVVSVIEAKNG